MVTLSGWKGGLVSLESGGSGGKALKLSGMSWEGGHGSSSS